MKSGLSDVDFEGVWDLISQRMGLEFPEGRRPTVIRNLTQASGAFGFEDLDGFVRWFLSTELNKKEIEILASYLTISETFFWREPHVFSALTDYVLPEMIKAKREGDKTIRIWSAGCSSGEEAYSLAIALHRCLPDIKEWNVKILATDINPTALTKAVGGIYTKWSFRNCPNWLKEGYFKDHGNERLEVVDKIKRMVTFRTLNLTDDLFPSFSNDTHSMDIIFCRNVLMYFTDEWVSRISRNLYKTLNNDGWFVVAACELSSHVFPQFKPINFKDAILYRKGDKVLTTDDVPVVIYKKENPDKKDDDMSGFSSGIVNVERFNPFLVIDQPVADSVLTTQPEMIHSGEGSSEKKMITETEPVIDVISKIRMLANQGDVQRALALCNEEIEKDKLFIGLYSLRALILQELDLYDEAIESLQRAIYLDPNFIMGHFALGNLFVRQKKTRNARMHFKNVLDLISSLEEWDIIPESEGLSVKYIGDFVKENMCNR